MRHRYKITLCSRHCVPLWHTHNWMAWGIIVELCLRKSILRELTWKVNKEVFFEPAKAYSRFVAFDSTLKKRIHEIRSVYCFLEKLISEYLQLFSYDTLAFATEGTLIITKPYYVSCKMTSNATTKMYKNCFNYFYTRCPRIISFILRFNAKQISRVQCKGIFRSLNGNVS